MEEVVVANNHRFYKTFSGILLSLITLLLAALLVVVIVGAIKIDRAVHTADKDFSNFNQQVQGINNSLQKAGSLPSNLRL